MDNKLERIVVSDTTAITYLSKIGAISLLQSLFIKFIYQELTRPGEANPGSHEVRTLNWIKVEKVANFDKIASRFGRKLDPGESQAIGLALQKKADLLVIDARAGRAEAKNFGIHITGIIGILIKAKQKGVIVTIKPYLSKLRLTNFKMAPVLYKRALELAEESDTLNGRQRRA